VLDYIIYYNIGKNGATVVNKLYAPLARLKPVLTVPAISAT